MNQMDEYYMNRCLILARQGIRSTYPNPMVGCVLVKNGKIVGEGWHKKAGEAHAEVIAVEQAGDENCRGATAYVSLEPCSHYGKTPPCADLLIEKGISRVVIANRDPNPKVNGMGILRLREAGIQVSQGVCEHEARELNRRFFCFQEKKRPYIILKWAQSGDELIAAAEQIKGIPHPISGQRAQSLNQKWRSEEHAILVGGQTAFMDNPSLLSRKDGAIQPERWAIDRKGKLTDPGCKLLQGENSAHILTAIHSHPLSGYTECLQYNMDDWNWLDAFMKELYRRQTLSLIVEGGTETLRAFYEKGLWDEMRVFINKEMRIGKGTASPVFQKKYPFSLNKLSAEESWVKIRRPIL